MKKIKYRSQETKSVVYFDDLAEYNLADCVVAYETKPHTEGNSYGLGVLVEIERCKKYGFRYHKDLVLNPESTRHTFSRKTRKCAVEAAMAAGREVYIFNSFREFVEYSTNNALEY